ncbi:MAG: hypothetical protein ABIR96_05735 [Bdellovibrionota bacterium]
MNQFATLLEYLDRLKAIILEGLAKIETSPYYDRILNRFESLEARHQKWAIAGARLLVLFIVAYFTLSPLVGLWSTKNRIGDQRSLLVEMKHFNELVETQPRPASPPSDWQPLAANTPEEAANSLKSYLGTLGFPEGSYQFLGSSNSHMQLDIPELNLRQAQAILYQIDGWYPKVSSQILSMKVHPDDEKKLTMSLTLSHHGGAGGADSGEDYASAGGGGGRRSSPRNIHGSDDEGNGPIKVPSETSSGGFDNAIPTERPRNPNLDNYPPNTHSTSEEGLPDFESLENNEALDALPPPPPTSDEEYNGND